MADDYKFVKVFGERNTGTRALIRMLAAQPEVGMQPFGEKGAMNLPQNSELRAVIEGTYKGKWRKVYRDALRDNEQAVACPTKAWKHTLPVWDGTFAAKRAHVVFCVRNPYSWVLSLARRPYHQKGPKTKRVLDFVTYPWLTVSRDNMDAVLRSPMDLWNGKVAGYEAFMKQAKIHTGVIRFENFVARPDVEVKRVLAEFNISHTEISRVRASTKDAKVSLVDISKYYAQEEWKRGLTAELVDAINVRTDWELAARFGYFQLEPSEFPSETTWKNLCHIHSWMSRSGSRL